MDKNEERYQLGNYELDAYPLLLLRKSILHLMRENQEFIERAPRYEYCSTILDYFEKENDVLDGILRDIERYFYRWWMNKKKY